MKKKKVVMKSSKDALFKKAATAVMYAKGAKAK